MKKTILGAVLFSALFLSCKKDNTDPQNVAVQFDTEHQVEGDALLFDTLLYTTNFGHKYSVTKLVYFVSKIGFVHEDGDTIYLDKSTHYVDGQDASTHSFSETISLKQGTYSKVILTYGLDSTINEDGLFNSLPELSMDWPDAMMGPGYHYMKLEGQYDSLALGQYMGSFKAHAGPTMHGDYSFIVTGEGFEVTESTSSLPIHLTMEVGNWFSGASDFDFSLYQSGVMMNMSAQMLLRNNGKTAITIGLE